MIDPAQPLPALRPVEVFLLTDESGVQRLVLQDNSRLAPEALALTPAGYFILTHLDGRHSAHDIQRAFAQQAGVTLPLEPILELVRVLDEGLFLTNDRSRAAYAGQVAAYQRGDVRDNSAAWPDEATLRGEILALLDGYAPQAGGNVVGIIAPHLDYARGGPCYGPAYGELRAAGPAKRYVILGTNHFGQAQGVVATGKDFQTPLGRVRTDRAFLERVARRTESRLDEHEFDHLREHSVELQVHVLQTLFAAADFAIVPILCPDPCGPLGTEPLDELAAALAAELEGDAVPTVVIAGADLSHVGQRFGEPEATDAAFLAQVASSDRAFLDLMLARREREAVERVRAVENATRICSVGCIYALLRALPERRCTLLNYHQAVDFEAETHVTCAAAVVG